MAGEKQLSDGRPSGTILGQSSTDLVTVRGSLQIGSGISEKLAFFGTTPITQRAAAAQLTSAVATASSSDITTEVKAFLIEVGNTMVALGLWKGAA